VGSEACRPLGATLPPMLPSDLSDADLEARLRERAALRGYRFEAGRTLDGEGWLAAFKADPLPGQEELAPDGLIAMSAESSDRRRALEDLLALDDLARERGR
jgi:hypothetical protein